MGRILGIDYGERRIGLALSDPLHIIASPYDTLIGEASDSLSKLKDIIESESVTQIVLGLPIGMKGQDTALTEKVREFALQLEVFSLPIHFQDERLSSVSAQKSLIQQDIKTGHNKGLIDQRAAAIILQQFLDTHSL